MRRIFSFLKMLCGFFDVGFNFLVLVCGIFWHLFQDSCNKRPSLAYPIFVFLAFSEGVPYFPLVKPCRLHTAEMFYSGFVLRDWHLCLEIPFTSTFFNCLTSICFRGLSFFSLTWTCVTSKLSSEPTSAPES